IALLTRTLGFLFVILVVFQIGPEAIWSEDTGTNILDLVTTLIAIFLFAGYVLPLLLDFGLLELFGIIMKKIMLPIFTLPGRSSIDSLVSWLGDGTIGVMLTNKQYEEGYYTNREAEVIGITFYLTISLAGLAPSIIMPIILPLSKKADTLYEHAVVQEAEPIENNQSLWKRGMREAALRAKEITSFKPVVKGGTHNVLMMWLEVVPDIMAVNTSATKIADFTPIIN